MRDESILIPNLLEEGWCNGGENTFRLFSWIKGVELEKVIGDLSEEQQYQLGIEAGKTLKEIHKVSCPPDQTNWSTLYNRKVDQKIERYQRCGISIPNAKVILEYIKDHRELLEERPQCFQHGDFHIGNMLFTPDRRLAVIDFNRLDFGDPWEEFNRITWSASQSGWFASGQIDGYFEHEVPDDFFKLMALYIGVNQLGAIPWAIPFGSEQIKVMLDQTNEVLKWYDNYNLSIPNWYK